MMKLEGRIRSGLHETAERMPDTGFGPAAHRRGPRRPAGLWMGVAAVVTVLVLFSPFLFLGRSEPALQPAESVAPGQDEIDADIVLVEGGIEFAKPEHVRLRFTQELSLTCQGLETVDNGGFDRFDMDIWIDHTNGYARLGFDYPDGSSHDLLLQGRPDDWQRAWGLGADRGRSAGCREYLEDGGYDTAIAGWAYQDASELWFSAYLQPVFEGEEGLVVNFHGEPTEVTPIGTRTILLDDSYPDGSKHRYEYTLDETGHRIMGEERYVLVPDQFEADATIEVLESGPAELPPDIFDTSTFTPLWSDGPEVVTTKATTP